MKMLQRAGTVMLACALGACGSDASDEDVETARGSAKGLKGDGEVHGAVTRSVALSKSGNGVGPLHISLADECLSKAGTAPNLIAKIDVDEVDLSEKGARVPFEITGLPDGTYFAATWFDDVVNKDQDEDLPGKGDLAMFKAATPICVKVEVKDSKIVEDVKLVLNYEMPFDLTGVNADERGGVLDDDGNAMVDPADIDYDDPNTYEVSFDLTRSVDPAEGGDGVGSALFTLSETCFDPTGDPPPPLYVTEKQGVDLSGESATSTLSFKGVKNGIYQLNGYLDDVGEHTDARPLPSTGDLVRFGGFGPACVQVVVNGGNVTTTFDLNLVMTWDLNG